MTPQSYYRIHAKKRLDERFGIIANRIFYKDLVARVKRPNRPKGRTAWHIVASWKNQNRSLWLVRYNEQFIPVIYDKKYECIITILPNNVIHHIDKRILKKSGFLDTRHEGER